MFWISIFHNLTIFSFLWAYGHLPIISTTMHSKTLKKTYLINSHLHFTYIVASTSTWQLLNYFHVRSGQIWKIIKLYLKLIPRIPWIQGTYTYLHPGDVSIAGAMHIWPHHFGGLWVPCYICAYRMQNIFLGVGIALQKIFGDSIPHPSPSNMNCHCFIFFIILFQYIIGHTANLSELTYIWVGMGSK